MDKLDLLKESLQEYILKWDKEIHKHTIEDPEEIYETTIIQRNAMKFLAQWIINSINGGLDKIHSTNICNIILKNPPALS